MNYNPRLLPSFSDTQAYLVQVLGCRRPPVRMARLAVILVLLWRKEKPLWTRATLAKAAGYAGTEGVDKAIQALLKQGLFEQAIKIAPGASQRGPSIRRLRHMTPSPELTKIVLASVVWP